MSVQQKAKEIYEKFYYAPDKDGYHSSSKYRAKIQSIICVNEIIASLQITTGHCSLNKLELHEVRSDVCFWNKVIAEIEALPTF
jgi:hypothetical protein